VNLKGIRTVLVSREGQLRAELYRDSDPGEYLNIQSATKSVISTLVGIAVTRGELTGLDQQLSELLPHTNQ
jgi:CubicO group peptidase (beta-lactamase class C family)